jgi:hypothetical protein
MDEAEGFFQRPGDAVAGGAVVDAQVGSADVPGFAVE